MNVQIKEIFEKVKSENRKALLEHEAKEILRLLDLPLPPSKLVKTEEEAIMAFNEFNGPVAMKVMSPQVLHKTDEQAVKIGIATIEEVKKTFNDYMNRFAEREVVGILVEKMVEKGVELIIGSQIDKTFGPVILVGPGGIFVEALKDVVFRMCPCSKEQALSAIDEIKTQKLLNGFRGLAPVNREQLAEIMSKLSNLAWEYREYIGEMDINPLIANSNGIFPVDARIILK
ncbi:MAG: acetate--CoA ligase family protein [Candidatus Heimdallarchaeum aukensis]|uniref:Acetate--CoA ligase family protein n=1 Tax=Candidatus Heimdallarchaeum aukensis TaxID=2876573 RepID=A0A9Y1BN68_9ARCH|nr:MAG: acetate--CoA ligase family protein [Candidatus Heimdallarchaeum aukensis]